MVQLVGGTTIQAGRSWVRFPMVPLGFFLLTLSFRPHYSPGVDSVSNRNKYQEYFLAGKGCRCVRLTTLPPSCAVMKSASLNLLEPPGPVQACTGIVLSYRCFSYWRIKRPGREVDHSPPSSAEAKNECS